MPPITPCHAAAAAITRAYAPGVIDADAAADGAPRHYGHFAPFSLLLMPLRRCCHAIFVAFSRHFAATTFFAFHTLLPFLLIFLIFLLYCFRHAIFFSPPSPLFADAACHAATPCCQLLSLPLMFRHFAAAIIFAISCHAIIFAAAAIIFDAFHYAFRHAAISFSLFDCDAAITLTPLAMPDTPAADDAITLRHCHAVAMIRRHFDYAPLSFIFSCAITRC